MSHRNRARLLLVPTLLAACASLGAPRDTAGAWPDAAGAVAHPELAQLAVLLWEDQLAADPIEAGRLGDERWLDRLPPVTRAALDARQRRLEDLSRRAAAIDEADCNDEDRVTLALLREAVRDRLALLEARTELWSVDPRRGPQLAFFSLVEDQPTDTPARRQALLRRWSAMADSVDATTDNLLAGRAQARVANRGSLERVIAQLERLLAQPVEEWPLAHPRLPPGLSASEARVLRGRILAILHEELRPAFVRHHAALVERLLPAARSDEAPGLASLPGGAALYADLIRAHTGLPLTPRELHDFGLAEVARIRAEIAALGRRVFGTDDVAEIQRRLRGDPALHFATREEVQRAAEQALARAEQAVPAAFGRLPNAPCIVVPIPDHEAPDTTIAYYRGPASDGSRPGRYYVNTWAPTTRTRYEAEVLAFHEAVPGHHLQIALAQELTGLPRFRREDGSTAFVEGWALYTERLCEELQLYGGDLDRFGVLSFDAWRACRLVVDTGLHAEGWSRQRAESYLLDNTLLAPNNVVNEVDRYITTPGQALAYKVGQREILALREQARAALGERFSLAEFHDVVLGRGAVSLSVLRAQVERWIAEQAAAR